MMKNIPELSTWMEQYQGNEVFYSLLESYESALANLVQAKEEKTVAKEAYQLAMEDENVTELNRLSLLTRFRRAKYLFLAEKAGFLLAKYALEHWVDEQTGGQGKKPGKKKK